MTICATTQVRSSLARIEGPTSDPVSLDDGKAWLRIRSDREIDIVDSLIKVATAKLDGIAGVLNPARCLMPQTWRLDLDAFPAGEIVLPLVPVLSITGVTYQDANGAEQTVSDYSYTLVGDEWSARLVLPSGGSWPSAGSGTGVVSVDFVAGYEQLPAQLRQDVLTFLGYWFDNRTMVGQLPPGWTSMYRRPVLA